MQYIKISTFSFLTAALVFTGSALAQNAPTLIITNQPLPDYLRDGVYAQPARAPIVTPQDILNPETRTSSQVTLVTKKMLDLRDNLTGLQGRVSDLSQKLNETQRESQQLAASYYADIGTISTQLQSGTTPGNPRLIRRLDEARASLQGLGQNLSEYNSLSVNIADAASTSTFLLTEARAAYSLSGAVEEDHVLLAELEDAINNTIVVIDRLQTNVNDDVARTSAYLSTEQNNLQTLSLAVSNGDFYARALTDRPFSTAPATRSPEQVAFSPAAIPPSPQTPKPLVKIRFDKPDVAYEQPVYTALNEAILQYPEARFELVAVEPTVGNAAQIAIESTRARRNAEKVLRSLSQMGVDTRKIDLATAQSESATSSEVHIYLR